MLMSDSFPNKSRINQVLLLSLGIGVLIYATWVIVHVSLCHEIGLKTVLTPHLVDRPEVESINGDHPDVGDLVIKVGDLPIRSWSELILAPGRLYERIASGQASPEWYRRADGGRDFVAVECLRPSDGKTIRFQCELQRFPAEDMIPSLIWLFLKGSLFVIGALVYWKRPDDEAAVRFYILCVITLGAYIGGYHWTHIVAYPVLNIIFMTCAVLLPVASLHFYLVFPRPKAWLEEYPGSILTAVYGVPLLNLALLIGFYLHVRYFAGADSAIRQFPLALIYISFGIATVWYLACMGTLFHSVRTVEDSMELKQVKCILIGVFFSHIPIGHSLYIVLAEPAKFVDGAVTWPMFVASLIVTVAFAIGMTRYRLLELEKIINSSVGYFLVSFLAGLMYYGVVFVGTLFYSRFVSSPTLPAALTVSTTALIFVFILDAARNRIQLALDRRFSQGKSQIDQTLEQMSQAVSQLVDPPALAQQLLATVSNALGITHGVVFLRQGDSPDFLLVAKLGDQPCANILPADSPLFLALESGLALECPAPSEDALTPAQAQLRQLGGEVAQPLRSEGRLVAVMILGSKDTPYRPEDWTLLAALAQITSVALESAAQHRTIDLLNQELQAKVDKIAEQQRRILALQSELHRKNEPPPKKPEPRPAPEAEGAPLANAAGIVGSSPVVRQLLTLVRKVAATDAVVLVRGESGTGKELLARAVHENSSRAGKPYVKVHCAALSPSLLESELFGHVRGAFTGAHKDKVGRFELADGGTLFLDEIGDISLDVQTKLLRVLQEKTIERVGSSESQRVDVRIIAATHQDLERLIREGRFREDLFYRLNVIPIEVPPLRERVEDIPELAMAFIQQSSQRCKKNVTQIDDDALALLKAFPWPGNIRQLENVIERAVVIAEGNVLTLQEMPPEVFQVEPAAVAQPVMSNGLSDEEAEPTSTFRAEQDRFEREQIQKALAESGGNKSKAARKLGIARTTLISRLRKLGLD